MCIDPIILKPIHIDDQNVNNLNVDDDHDPFPNNLTDQCSKIALTENDHAIFDEFSVIKEENDYDSYSCFGGY